MMATTTPDAFRVGFDRRGDASISLQAADVKAIKARMES
jgi:hypothetical protein